VLPKKLKATTANGNLTGIAKTDGSAGWGYDNLDRLTAEQVRRGGTDAGRRLCAKGARGCDPLRLPAALMNDGNILCAVEISGFSVVRASLPARPAG
jgi:YD repeat-containing protein